jgi:hypothetical protein
VIRNKEELMARPFRPSVKHSGAISAPRIDLAVDGKSASHFARWRKNAMNADKPGLSRPLCLEQSLHF